MGIMHIISGKHHGRRIEAPEGKQVRPTAARTREAVFNILMHGIHAGEDNTPLIGKNVLDLFCGSGAMGLEALSRGAGLVTFVDQSQESLNYARANAERFGEVKHARFVRSDSAQLPPSHTQHALALVDPPYHSGLGPKALESMREGNWLEPNAVVVLELSHKEPVIVPAGYTEYDRRKYGNTQIILLRLTQ